MTHARRFALLIFLALLATPAAASAAGGHLVVAPVRGPGLVVAAPDGSHARTICSRTQLCGAPTRPSVAPDGQAIAFVDRHTGQPVIVAPDGSCLWCLGSGRLDSPHGRTAAFDGNAAIIVTGSKMQKVSLGGGRTRGVSAGTVPAGATSPGGAVVVVRGGWISVRARAGARLRRLQRGSSPAWSPDGRMIAYVAPGGQVRTMTAQGDDPRNAGTLRGRSLAWAPLPTSTCAGPGRVMRRDSTAVLRDASTKAEARLTGCLLLTGRTRTVASGDLSEDHTRLTAPTLAGRFAAAGQLIDVHTGGCDDSLQVVDLARARRTLQSEIPGNPCNDAIDSIALDASGFAAWHADLDAGLEEGGGPSSITCPASTLCLALDGTDDSSGTRILYSTDPASATQDWSEVAAPDNGQINGLSCPTTSFCLATAAQGVWTTSTPTEGPAAWTFTALPTPATFDPSCPSASFCAVVAGSTADSVLASSDPAGGAGTWTGGATGQSLLTGLSCGASTLCAATGGGKVLVSADPGQATTWAPAAGTAAFNPVTCPSASLCVAASSAPSELVATSDPASAAQPWTKITLPGSQALGLGAATCGTANLCVATSGGELWTSSDPASPGSWSGPVTPPAYQSAILRGGAVFGGASACAGTSLCVLGEGGPGAVLASTDPADASTFTQQPLLAPPVCFTLPSCVTEQLTVHDDHGTRIVDSAPVGAGGTIAGLTMAPDSTTLSWTDNGQPRSLTLR
jgi:hypothetical protein